MVTVTIKTTSTEVELTKALIKYMHGTITEGEFLTTATTLGYTPRGSISVFAQFAYEQALRMLGS